MPNRVAETLIAAALTVSLAVTALADTDPTLHQIYEAASSGHLPQAQQMIEEVLRDHPDSAKAHYVQAELFAREGKFSRARAELDRAEQLSPGLPQENPRSVAELRSELGVTRSDQAPRGHRESTARFPWGTWLILLLAVGLLWRIFRSRTSPVSYPSGGAPAPAPTTGTAAPPSPAVPGTYAAALPVAGGGIGSTVAGGLAGGLAAGAGVVAGEALAHHFIDGDHSGGSLPAASGDRDSDAPNSDMGGTDFGAKDPDSWDDDSAGGDGGGGGDDWT